MRRYGVSATNILKIRNQIVWRDQQTHTSQSREEVHIISRPKPIVKLVGSHQDDFGPIRVFYLLKTCLLEADHVSFVQHFSGMQSS